MSLNLNYIKNIVIITIIFTIFLGANSGIVVSQSIGNVSVERIINGTKNIAVQYRSGDMFTVQLDYTVTGSPDIVSLIEALPSGWVIMDSSADYSYDSVNNTYIWYIASPLTGVKSGSISYIVQIPNSTANGDYNINGTAVWFYGKNAYSGNIISSTIVIADNESNGPCIWISRPIEEIGDGDGHLEAGEWATYHYFIYDKDGINSYTFYVNGNICNNDTIESSGPDFISGSVHAQVTRQPEMKNNLTIVAEDSSGNSNSFSSYTYVPWYDYTAWMTAESDGIAVHTASYEPSSSLEDGGWTILQGGNPIRIPAMEMHYNGPDSINKKVNINKNYTFSWKGFMMSFNASGLNANGTLNVTPRKDVYVPFDTYPIYSEYNGANNVVATFYGSPEMSGVKFHVILLNLSAIGSKINLANISTISDSVTNLTISDIKSADAGSVDVTANASGDFVVNGGKLPQLNNMKQGYYALLVMDYNIPNVPCMVSIAPIIVTKSGMTVDPWEAHPMPGDTIHLNLSQLGAPSGGEYMYFAAIIPEREYGACLNITSDGTANGTKLSFNGIVNLTAANATLANVSAGNTSVTPDTSATIALFTNKTQPPVRYVLLALAVDRNTGNMAAINQTYIHLEAIFTLSLYEKWNLISYPLVNTSIKANDFSTISSDIVASYNNTNGDYDVYLIGLSPPELNFTLSTDYGYFINCTVNSTFDVLGSWPVSRTRQLSNGWNLIGWSTFSQMNTTNANTMIPGTDIIARYNRVKAGYDVYIIGTTPDENAFIMMPGEGYFVNMTTPGAINYGGI